jgi:hypothetical protein
MEIPSRFLGEYAKDAKDNNPGRSFSKRSKALE